MTVMRGDQAARWIVLVALVGVLVAVNLSIRAKEQTLAQGQRMVLQLAPADPRSLMQGDYMRIRFALAEEIRLALGSERSVTRVAVVAPDAQGVAHLVRMDDGRALMPGEQRLLFRVRRGTVRVVTDAWFFQEGQAKVFESARYGELRAAADGEALLVALLDQQMQPIAPGR